MVDRFVFISHALLVFERLNIKSVDRRRVDEALADIRVQLSREFDRINAKLEISDHEAFREAQTSLIAGLQCLERGGDSPEVLAAAAADQFHQGLRSAEIAFNDDVAPFLFDIKAFASKLRILLNLHIAACGHNPAMDGPTLRAALMKIWDDVMDLKDVKVAISEGFEKPFLKAVGLVQPRSLRKHVLFVVSHVRSMINHVILPFDRVEVTSGSGSGSGSSSSSSVIGSSNRLKPSDAIAIDLFQSKPVVYSTASKVHSMLVWRNRLYCGLKSSSIKVWDITDDEMPSDEPLGVLPGRTDWVTAMVTDGEGTLFSATSAGTVMIWDVSGEDLPKSPTAVLLAHADWIAALAVYRGKLYSGSDDTTIKVWDVSTAAVNDVALRTINGHSRAVTALVVTTARGRLFSASDDSTIKMWDISREFVIDTPMAVLEGHCNWIKCLAVAGDRLYSGSIDETIRVWDISERGPSSGPVPTKAIARVSSPGDRILSLTVAQGRLFAGVDGASIRVWTIERGEGLKSGSSGKASEAKDSDRALELSFIAEATNQVSWVSALAVSGGKLYSASCTDKSVRARPC